MGNEESMTQRSGITDREIAILRANTNFSESDIRANYDEFQRECPSGKMNKTQFRKFFRQYADPNDQNGAIADKMFNVFDQNKDGTMNFHEFIIACAMIVSNDLDSQLDLVFTTIDSSNDGSITYQEMLKFIEFAKQVSKDADYIDPRAVATAVFSKFNLDRNQKLSKKQFVEGVKNNKELKDMFSGFGKS